jgi:hypothetical protein
MLVASTGLGLLLQCARERNTRKRLKQIAAVIACCTLLPGRIRHEVDEVVCGHGGAGHGAFAVLLKVLEDERLKGEGGGEDEGAVDKFGEGEGRGGRVAFSKRRPVVLETTGCCGGEPLMEQASADIEGGG